MTIPGRIERAELVDAGDTLGQKLLVSGETNGVDSPPSRAHWTVALERAPESLPDAVGNPTFVPKRIRGRLGIPRDDVDERSDDVDERVDDVDERSDGVHRSRGFDHVLPPSTVPDAPALSAQVGASADGRGPLIASLRGSVGALALFDPSDECAPCETHRVPPGTTSVRVAGRLVFAVGRAREGRARGSPSSRGTPSTSTPPRARDARPSRPSRPSRRVRARARFPSCFRRSRSPRASAARSA